MCASYRAYSAPLSVQEKRAYSIDYTRPGVVIIFNNKTFSKYDRRNGSEQDVRELCNLFRGLEYEVPPPFINQTEAEMRKAIDDFSKRD